MLKMEFSASDEKSKSIRKFDVESESFISRSGANEYPGNSTFKLEA